MRVKLTKLSRIQGSARTNRMGFTLTEAIVASSLLVIAIVPVLKALTVAHLNAAIVERRTHSLNFAQAKLSEVRARSIYNYSLNFSGTDSGSAPYLCEVADPNYSQTPPDLRKIVVSAGYDIDGNMHLSSEETFVMLDTLITRRW